jgi:hypothetical protein
MPKRRTEGGAVVQSSLIGKIEKAKRYAEEKNRVVAPATFSLDKGISSIIAFAELNNLSICSLNLK